LRSDAKFRQNLDKSLTRGRIRTKISGWGNVKVRTKFFEKPKWVSDLPTDNQGSYDELRTRCSRLGRRRSCGCGNWHSWWTGKFQKNED
jgi:hypothetical protein